MFVLMVQVLVARTRSSDVLEELGDGVSELLHVIPAHLTARPPIAELVDRLEEVHQPGAAGRAAQ